MRKVLPEKLEEGRLLTGQYASDPSWGPYGYFRVHGPCGETLTIIASGGEADDPSGAGWEHVSISTHRRCPNWKEMSFVKDLFWDDEECVVQFHPPKSDYVNNHAFVLHLWRHKTQEFPRPPAILVGVKSFGELKTPAEAQAARDAIFRHDYR